MAENEGGGRKIKVVDRRWFDESGQLRKGRPASSAPEEPSESAVRGESQKQHDEGVREAPSPGAGREPAERSTPPESSSGAGVSWPSSVNFVQMVDFLAQQAMLLLSGGQGIPANPEQARIFIDFLGILEERTRGNLSPEEARILGDVLFQLRALYVQQMGR